MKLKSRLASNIKLSVILGYILVVTVMTIGLITLYNNLVDFSNKKIRNEDTSELMIVSSILSLLYEVESEQNLLTSESARQYYIKYDSVIPEVNSNLNKLKEFSDDITRKLKLDSISILMQSKNENLLFIASLLDSVSRSPGIIRESVSRYVPSELNREISEYLERKNLHNPNTIKSDTSIIARNRKGFFDRVRDVFVANPDSTIIIENKSVVTDNEIRVIVDTIVNKVRFSERLDLRKQREFHTALIERQEVMNHNNRMLTARIDELLKNIEQEEIRKSLLLISERESTLSESQNTMLIVSLLSIIIAILFALLFLIDINKSQRYRTQLESSNKRITDLLGYREKLMLTISHDIKAPTGSILGYIDLLTDEKDHKKSESYLQNIKISAENVLQLVSRLLDYHKLEKGSWQLQESCFDINKLIKETTNVFRALAEKKGLKYRVVNHLPEKMFCYGDSYVLRQILYNLISNAIKYTSRGEIEINITYEVSDIDNILIFTVTDTGEGIDIEDQKIIFNEFMQVNNTFKTGERIDGSGLGLAITKGFVKELRGDIKLTSAKGEGSEFVVKIPLKSIPKDNLNETYNLNYEQGLEGVSILYVDDDPIQLKMITEIALKKKISCVTESNPDNVLALLQSNKFDILFIDIQLGGKSGFDLVDSINKKYFRLNKEIPIVALSARSDISKSEIQSSGFTNFLYKPFTTDQLYRVITKYVKDNGNDALVKENTKSEGVIALYDFVKEDNVASSEILKSFINETRESELVLREAFINDDIETAARISHKMLPLFRMMGNKRVVSIMEQLEDNKNLKEEDKQYLLKAIKSSVEEGAEHRRVLNSG